MANYSGQITSNVAKYLYEYDCMAAAAILLLLKNRKSPHKMYRQRNGEGTLAVLIDRHLIDDDTKFKEYFRLSPFLFSKVLDILKEDLVGIATNWVQTPITARHKLCVTLRYLATGESFRSLAFQFRMHRTTIGRIVEECLGSIIARFLQQAIPTPTTDSLEKSINDFYTRWNFPNCCGTIDGKHVRIICPDNAGSSYFNYKDFHSIVLLAIVDANYKFIAVDVGSYGREGDAGIFLKCEMGKLINSGNFNIPPPAALPNSDVVLPNVILGDEAFALSRSMMKPFPRAQSLHDASKAIYNYRHCRARRTTENVFGIMASSFRIFFTPIHTTPEKIDQIILASCILHNMMRDEKFASPAESTFENTDDVVLPTENLIGLSNSLGRPTTEGKVIRDKFKDYFNGVGAVDWQQRMIQ